MAMIAALDQISRDTVARFTRKLAVAALLAVFSKTGHLIAMAAWLSVFAVVIAATALLFRQRFSPSSFNLCDEAIWLMAASHGLRLVHLWMA